MKALTFVLILIISTQFIFAQNKREQNVPVPVRDSIIYYEGVMKANPDLTTDQLYQQVRHWASTKNIVLPATAPVLYENPKEGLISARFVFNSIRFGPAVYANYLLPHGIIYFQIKQGKIKYIITDISYTHGEYNVSYYWERLGNSKNLIFKATSERNTKAIRSEFMHYLTEMNQIIQNQLVSLQAFISKPLFDEF